MAIIVGSLQTPENIGRLVDIVARASYCEAFEMTDGTLVVLDACEEAMWRIRSDVPLKWRASDGELYEAFEVAASDRFLLPVTGLPVEDDVRDEATA
ncbi:hypothetical protein [Paraburkholderia heleia]|uniref:hypothetical protein n=1 Tax=Paraburkholderia heleia TaxID=634127 RepID=UPI002AB70EC9|nr:hypothetical protein [Paraburkholderia heleia]